MRTDAGQLTQEPERDSPAPAAPYGGAAAGQVAAAVGALGAGRGQAATAVAALGGGRGRVAARQLAALQRAVGNRATGKLLARIASLSPASALTLARAPDLGAWAAAQDDWGVLEDSRNLVEQAPAGGSVTLLGDKPISVVVDDGTRAALRSAIRHRLLEILYDWRRDLDIELASTRGMASRRDQQLRIGRTVGPLYQAIRRGKPEDQILEYPKDAPNATAIIQAALSTAELMGELAGELTLESQDKDPSKAHVEAMAHSKLGEKAEWCGAFASMELAAGGLSLPAATVLPNPLLGTAPPAPGNLDGFFLYLPRLEVQVGDDWIDVESYHAQRGSKRRYQVLPGGGGEWDTDTADFQGRGPRRGLISGIDQLDARPGDVVLIDNQKGTYADHITMCRSYDSATHTLWTLGGNEGDAHPVHASDARDLDKNPAPARGAFGEKPSRVYAVCGFSVVDFEPHTYRVPPQPNK
jgi:hypothetical protein